MTIEDIKIKSLNKESLSQEEAEFLIYKTDHYTLFHHANEIRENFLSNEVSLCSIVNAKSGYCPEDCGFCGQSSKFNTHAPTYKLLDMDELKYSIHNAQSNGANEFSFVTSGKKISNPQELDLLTEAIKYTKEHTDLEACSSLGLMTKEELTALKEAGMDHFHHNLETSRSHFPNIVSTHSYDQQLEVVKHAKELGLHTCCGGIFGMGESWEQRLELAEDLKKLDVHSIPMNFLNPIEGTPLGGLAPLKPFEALRIVALYRFLFPDKNIMVMGGREKILGDFQSWIFFAGASGMLIGNYLITEGRSIEDDHNMLKELGLVSKSHCTTAK